MPGIFISYRRDDSGGYAGRLYDAMVARFGSDSVFMDIDSIRGGEDFVDVIDQRIASCSVVVVLIGKGWLKIADDQGRRRLENPRDFVRLEITSALKQKVPVVPVLVGGATMPRPEDLPPPLVHLVHLNAVELFDQLFPESVGRLVNTLQRFVRARVGPWHWQWPLPRNVRRLLVSAALLALLGIATLFSVLRSGPNHSPTKSVALSPDATLAGPEQADAIRVKVMEPSDVSELPPVIAASRNVMFPGSSGQVTGPMKPRIAWRAAVTIGDAWHVLGIAEDGTVYLYDNEHNVVEGIRDGKEQWAYSARYPRGFSDGRLWLEDPSSGVYCFNSLGQGGHIVGKGLQRYRATLRLENAAADKKYGCSDAKVFAMTSHGDKTWSIDLDGNCGSQDPMAVSDGGNVYANSDARTLYSIAPTGQLLWKLEKACKEGDIHVYPLSSDDLILACRGEPLYGLRGGKQRWSLALKGSSDWSWSDPVFDKAGRIYLGAAEPSPASEFVAVDDLGKLVWTVPGGERYAPKPVGFDPQGRLYVLAGAGIVCLSD